MALKLKPVALTTSLATVYTCPAGTEASAHGIVFSNTNATDATITLTLYQAATATTYTLVSGLVVTAEKTFAWPRPLNMGAGDYIQASASTTGVTVAASIYEGTTTAVGFTPMGVWSSTTAYNQNDVVSYNGASYVAAQAGTNQTPGVATAYWTLLSSKGDAGTAATVAVGTTTTGTAGSSASVTNSGSSSAAVFNFTIPRGDTGSAATVAVGTTTTGAAGSSASVTNSGTSSAAVFNFTIPRGDTGATGTAATVAAGTTTTGAAGTNASVTNSGTSSAAVFNFTIPRGDTGDTGPTGPRGITMVSPGASENATLFYTTSALTLSSVWAVLTGTSPSITFSIASGSSRASATTTHVNAQTVTSTTTGTSVTIANTSIPANSWVWITTSAASGTIGTFHTSLNFA